MQIGHKAGDKFYVYFDSKKLPVVESQTVELTGHEIYVAVLGCSQFSYIEAIIQKKPIGSKLMRVPCVFFGGLPRAILPDCLKSAVKSSNKYKPQINATYQDFAGILVR